MHPNLFVIGAMKCGTTSFHDYLAQHPDICMSAVKEPCHFIDPDTLAVIWPEMAAQGFADPARYLSLFEACRSCPYRGESSTDYAKWPLVVGVPEKMRAASPDARLFFLFRDPAARTISHYLHNVRYGRESRPFAEAVRPDSEYVLASCYATQLRRFADAFGRDRIRAIRAETLAREPERVVRAAWSWLGLDPSPPLDVEKRHHVTQAVITIPPRSRRGIGRLLGAAPLAPVRRWLPARLRQKLRARLGAAVDGRALAPGALDDRIVRLLADETARVGDVVDILA